MIRTLVFASLVGLYVLACSSCQVTTSPVAPSPSPSDSVPPPQPTQAAPSLGDGGPCASACDRARATPCNTGRAAAALAHCLAVCTDAAHSVSGPTIDCVARIATCDEVCPR